MPVSSISCDLGIFLCQKGGIMAEEDIITGGIEAFKRLLDFEYKITLGRKGQLKTITLSFSKSIFII